jgi:hypothetical protein
MSITWKSLEDSVRAIASIKWQVSARAEHLGGVNFDAVVRPSPEELILMGQKLTLVYWKGDHFWLGKLLEHPEIMTQGETIEELEENLKDAFRLMALDEVPKDCRTKEIAL